jgi:TIGR00252 family protein
LNTKLLGRWGETKAGDYLKSKGYKLIGMNYITRFGEIDLIAENRQYIIFVEVKLRKSAAFAEAREYVDRRKIEKIKTSAEIWLSQNETEKMTRFDVIEVYFSGDPNKGDEEIIHIEDAFQ